METGFSKVNWFLKGETRQVLAIDEVFEFAFSAKVLAEIRLQFVIEK